MPIYTPNNTFMHRILNGDIEVKRVYEGDTLAGGLYEIIYHNKDEDTSDYKPNRYVWGLKYDLYQLETDEFDEYLMHCDGGYEDKLFVTAIPYITKDFHKDLELFVKWRRRKYSYSGTIRWWKGDSGGGGGIDSAIPTEDYALLKYNGQYSDYFGDSSLNIYAYSGNYMANCTTYAYGRALKAGLPGPTNSVRGADNWAVQNYLGSGGTFYSYTDTSTIANVVQPGDIIVGHTHVSFVENNGLCSASWGTSEGHRGTPQDASDYYTSTSSLRYRFYHCVSINTEVGYPGGGGGHHNEVVGYIRNSGGGGGGTWDSEPLIINKKVLCGYNPTAADVSNYAERLVNPGGIADRGSQENPDFPSADSIIKGDTHNGEYRNSIWSDTSGDSTGKVFYTDTSQYNYNINQWSEGTNEATQDSKTDPNAHFLMDWD